MLIVDSIECLLSLLVFYETAIEDLSCLDNYWNGVNLDLEILGLRLSFG